MPLVFAAITPHPPLLIPNIGKDEEKKIKQTIKGLEILEQNLYIKKPQIILIISPHGILYHNAFTINAHTNFISSFEQFGDFSTKHEWVGTPELAAYIKERTQKQNIPIQLFSEEKLDHGVTVPLHFLTSKLEDTTILPIGYSGLDTKTHLEFGKILKEITSYSDKRIAIIASGDLSHGLTSDAPAGFSKVGQKFDNKIIELLELHNTIGIANMDEKFVKESAQCGYKSILILLGAIQNMNYEFKNLSYEGPFGVGYLTGEFDFA